MRPGPGNEVGGYSEAVPTMAGRLAAGALRPEARGTAGDTQARTDEQAERQQRRAWVVLRPCWLLHLKHDTATGPAAGGCVEDVVWRARSSVRSLLRWAAATKFHSRV